MNISPTERDSLQVLDHLSVLGDPVRCRILLLAEAQELTVSELRAVLQLPQSTVSRQLKTLSEAGWVTARRDGTSRRYSVAHGGEGSARAQIWDVLRPEIAASPAAAEDHRRLTEVLARRRTRSQEFFSSVANRWASMRSDLFGERFDLQALLSLLDPQLIVGDLGCGTGQTSDALSYVVQRVVAIDESDAMLDAARQRLGDRPNVELHRARLEALPLADSSLDAALALLVLHHVADPAAVLAETFRVLRPGGRVLLVDMLPHEREEFRSEMGHLWLGFEPNLIQDWLRAEGFDHTRIQPLTPDATAKGPSLFCAVARKRFGDN